MSRARRVLAFLWKAVRLEIALYLALARWLARRPDVPADATPVGYSRLVAPMLWLWILGSAVEVVVVEVVLRHLDQPWAAALRMPLLVLGIWGVLWMLGMLASYRVRPHVVTDDQLLVRSGAFAWAVVPLGVIESSRMAEHELPGVVRSLHVEGPLLLVGVGSRTNVELVLSRSTTLLTSRGEVRAGRVGIWVDEPRAVAAQLGGPRARARSS